MVHDIISGHLPVPLCYTYFIFIPYTIYGEQFNHYVHLARKYWIFIMFRKEKDYKME